MLISFSDLLSILDGFYLVPGDLDREKIRDAHVAVRLYGGGLWSHREVCDLLTDALGINFEPHPFGALVPEAAADDMGFKMALLIGESEEVAQW